MSDPAIPDRLGPATRWAIAGIALFVFFLLGAEEFKDGHIGSGLIFLALFIVTFVVAVKWEIISNGLARRRRQVALAFIVISAIGLMIGIFLLASNPSAVSSGSKSDREWILPQQAAERCVSHEIYESWEKSANKNDVNTPEFTGIADSLRQLLLDGMLLARGHRVILEGTRGERRTDTDLTDLRPADWQRFVLAGQNFTMAVSQDGIFGQYVALEMAVAKSCPAVTSSSREGNVPSAIKTSLRLQFYGDHRIPTEVGASENIYHWFALFSPSIGMSFMDKDGNEIVPPGGAPRYGPTWNVFIILKQPAIRRQIVTSFSNPEKMGPSEIMGETDRSFIFHSMKEMPAARN